jgi:hypothetical protein
MSPTHDLTLIICSTARGTLQTMEGETSVVELPERLDTLTKRKQQ